MVEVLRFFVDNRYKKMCKHEKFEYLVDAFAVTQNNSSDIVAYSADIRIRCSECKTQFEFCGVPAAAIPSPIQPVTSPDFTCLRVPITPKEEKKPEPKIITLVN